MTGRTRRPTAAAAVATEPAEYEYASADDLVASDLGEGEPLTLPSGKRVLVRGLSRHELMYCNKGTDDPALIERRNVVACLLQPRMTLAQVEAWQRNSIAGGDFKVLSEEIRRLSALGEGADKRDLRGDG